MESLFKAVDRFSTFTGRAVGQFYFILALITCYEVIMRYLFNAPTMWAFELVMLLCGIVWMLSVGYVTQQKGHIGITVLFVLAPRPVQWYLELFADVAGLLATATLAYACWPLMYDALTMHELSGTSFNSPEPMIAKTVVFLGASMYALQLLVNTLRHLQAYRDWR